MFKTNFRSKSRACYSTNNNSIRVLWLICKWSVYILTMVQVSNHYFKNCREVVETRTLLCHVYKTIFLSKTRVCNSSKTFWSEFCVLYAHSNPIFLLCCESQKSVLKTVGEVEETRTLLFHVYKTNFLLHKGYVILPMVIRPDFLTCLHMRSRIATGKYKHLIKRSLWQEHN